MNKKLFFLALCSLFPWSNSMSDDHDPYLWLEDIDGAPALNWVQQQNMRTRQALAQSDSFKKTEAELLAILNSNDKIPFVGKRGPYYYNFWQDAQHPRGLWRRTTLEEYRRAEPKWEVLLDLDALNQKEKTSWVWHGASCLRPDYQRCLISLSRSGSDADETREFDLEKREFVADGFHKPEAKGSLDWIDRDHVFVQTDFGPDSLTTSGYPRETRIWRRGTPLAEAQLVYRGEASDMMVAAVHDDTPGYERDFVSRVIDFYKSELFQRAADNTLTKIDVPDSASKSVLRDWLLISPREDWEINGHRYPAGSLLLANYKDWQTGKRELKALFTPDEHSSLAASVWTKNYLVLNILEDVKNRLVVLDPSKDWAPRELKGIPHIGTSSVAAVDEDEGDELWLTVSSYDQPTTLSLTSIDGMPEVLKALPAFFDASDLVSEQHFATSADGTKVPYFLVHHRDLKLDGQNPTLLYGYGGFEVALTPSYTPGVGKAWFSRRTADGRGGVYVVANIRGGGEYGPRWHQAALREKRPRAYEDFAAVAQDLIDKKITSPAHLGIQGGSNGGLLMGNMLTQYPERFGAIVIQVPLLDMKRYSQLLAGASWIAEYGDPSQPEQWAYLQTFSPYHLFEAKRDYPPVLFTTSTRDDRVHPGHARKMMAKMLAAAKNALYYENTEGGHGGAADNGQRAYMNALAYEFLWQELTKGL